MSQSEQPKPIVKPVALRMTDEEKSSDNSSGIIKRGENTYPVMNGTLVVTEIEGHKILQCHSNKNNCGILTVDFDGKPRTLPVLNGHLIDEIPGCEIPENPEDMTFSGEYLWIKAEPKWQKFTYKQIQELKEKQSQQSADVAQATEEIADETSDAAEDIVTQPLPVKPESTPQPSRPRAETQEISLADMVPLKPEDSIPPMPSGPAPLAPEFQVGKAKEEPSADVSITNYGRKLEQDTALSTLEEIIAERNAAGDETLTLDCGGFDLDATMFAGISEFKGNTINLTIKESQAPSSIYLLLILFKGKEINIKVRGTMLEKALSRITENAKNSFKGKLTFNEEVVNERVAESLDEILNRLESIITSFRELTAMGSAITRKVTDKEEGAEKELSDYLLQGGEIGKKIADIMVQINRIPGAMENQIVRDRFTKIGEEFPPFKDLMERLNIQTRQQVPTQSSAPASDLASPDTSKEPQVTAQYLDAYNKTLENKAKTMAAYAATRAKVDSFLPLPPPAFDIHSAIISGKSVADEAIKNLGNKEYKDSDNKSWVEIGERDQTTGKLTKGRAIFSNGMIEEGEFDTGSTRLIKGRIIYPNGTIKEGEFNQSLGNLIKGRIIYAHGTIEEGEFDQIQDKLIRGRIIHPDGTVESVPAQGNQDAGINPPPPDISKPPESQELQDNADLPEAYRHSDTDEEIERKVLSANMQSQKSLTIICHNELSQKALDAISTFAGKEIVFVTREPTEEFINDLFRHGSTYDAQGNTVNLTQPLQNASRVIFKIQYISDDAISSLGQYSHDEHKKVRLQAIDDKREEIVDAIESQNHRLLGYKDTLRIIELKESDFVSFETEEDLTINDVAEKLCEKAKVELNVKINGILLWGPAQTLAKFTGKRLRVEMQEMTSDNTYDLAQFRGDELAVDIVRFSALNAVENLARFNGETLFVGTTILTDTELKILCFSNARYGKTLALKIHELGKFIEDPDAMKVLAQFLIEGGKLKCDDRLLAAIEKRMGHFGKARRAVNRWRRGEPKQEPAPQPAPVQPLQPTPPQAPSTPDDAKKLSRRRLLKWGAAAAVGALAAYVAKKTILDESPEENEIRPKTLQEAIDKGYVTRTNTGKIILDTARFEWKDKENPIEEDNPETFVIIKKGSRKSK